MTIFQMKIKLRQAWNCITHFKKWRDARAIDNAICVLWNNGYNYDIAMDLKEISHELWEEIHG